jgi:long-chain fatty acid transport protein
MSKQPKLGPRLGLWLSAAVLTPGAAVAAGFQVRAGSPDWEANAFAGMAAKGYDASTVWTNPAAMTLLHESQVSNTLSLVLPNAKFLGENLVGGASTPGNSGGNAGVPAAVPGFAGVLTRI